MSRKLEVTFSKQHNKEKELLDYAMKKLEEIRTRPKKPKNFN